MFVQLYVFELNISYVSARSYKSEVGMCCNCVVPEDSVRFNQIRESQTILLKKKKCSSISLGSYECETSSCSQFQLLCISLYFPLCYQPTELPELT